MRKKINTKTYLGTLAATFILFLIALAISNYINNKKITELRLAIDNAATDILLLETQYDLFSNANCATFDNTELRNKLGELSSRITFMEGQLGIDNFEVANLKRYYSLLQLKDYLLTKKMSTECNKPAAFILYFYKTKDCDSCTKQEYMLQAVKQRYGSAVHIYSFDYELDLQAVQTLITLNSIPESAPVIDVNGHMYAPFKSLDDLEAIVSASLSTSTKNKR